MTKFDTTHNDNASSTLDRKRSGSRGFYVLGILMISLMAFAPVVDAGCSCSGGTWDPSGFLNADSGTGQSVQSGSAATSAGASPASPASPAKEVARSDSFPNGKILKPMKSVSSSDVVVDVSN